MAEKSTFIKLDRNILRWGWYGNGNVFRVFLHLLLVASTTDRELCGVSLKRGEALVTLEQLHNSLTLSVAQIRTAISALKKTREIAQRKVGKNVVFIVLNYDLYQGQSHDFSHNKSQDKSHDFSHDDNTIIATYKNDKNDKEYIYTLSNARAREGDTDVKQVYGSMYHNVLLSGEEYRALCVEFGKEAADGGIDILDGHIQKRGTAFRSECHAADIREWCVTKYKKLMAEAAEAERKVKQGQTAKVESGRLEFDLNDFFEGAKKT